MKIAFSKTVPAEEGKYFVCFESTGDTVLVNVEKRIPFSFAPALKKKFNPNNKTILAMENCVKDVKNYKAFWSEKLEFEVPNKLF